MRECIGVATIGRQSDDMRHESPDRTRRSALDSHGTRLLRLLLASASAAALTAIVRRFGRGPSQLDRNTSNDWMVGSQLVGGAVPIAGQCQHRHDVAKPDGARRQRSGGRNDRKHLRRQHGTAPGSLTIQNGSTLTSTARPWRIAGGSNGTVTVTGAGSQWITSQPDQPRLSSGNGTLNIQNGAKSLSPNPGLSSEHLLASSGTLNIDGGSTLRPLTSRARCWSRPGQFRQCHSARQAANATFISGFSGQVQYSRGRPDRSIPTAFTVRPTRRRFWRRGRIDQDRRRHIKSQPAGSTPIPARRDPGRHAFAFRRRLDCQFKPGHR
jgi:T5SS/PEP-CTERM-associated repeat protein